MTDKEEEFTFAIGFEWDTGGIGYCMFHSSEIHTGTMEYAKNMLKHAKENFGKEDKYKIYKFNIEEIK